MSPIQLRLAELRQARGWSQAELARRAGIQRTTVNRLERRVPQSLDVEVLDKLAVALDVEPGYLIRRASLKEIQKHVRELQAKRGRPCVPKPRRGPPA